MDFASIFSSFLHGFQITQAIVEHENAVIMAHVIPKLVLCPDCQCPTNRVHSYYTQIPHGISFGFFSIAVKFDSSSNEMSEQIG